MISLRMSGLLTKFQPGEKRKGIPRIFLVGVASGFILRPYTTPILAVLLSLVATKQNIVLVCNPHGNIAHNPRYVRRSYSEHSQIGHVDYQNQ